MNNGLRKCAQCQSTDLQQDHLSSAAETAKVMYGSRLFEKQKLLAYACNQCGFVSLYLGARAEDKTETG